MGGEPPTYHESPIIVELPQRVPRLWINKGDKQVVGVYHLVPGVGELDVEGSRRTEVVPEPRATQGVMVPHPWAIGISESPREGVG
eukprot:CAMPEP_0181288822 /NCGR_PEP_ID=MMETSP1101-20121128/548_1 /TAXON_ID=46948 /ORGANISM="Rhodomonas abbreviata, Strain Caron Lab Isolate" /LENGTH=85 /DNA_ID=CAMNT_0023392991 /DNA_START=130 /DNA_END=387 /DNA_ORIENTATION=-